MSMETGVEGGSALVPEVVWASSASMRLAGGFIMSIELPIVMFVSILFGGAPVVCGVGFCVAGISMPGISGMFDGFV
jgi:hypothetical protein